MANATAQTMIQARTLREKYQDDLKLLLNSFEGDVKRRLPKYADAVVRRAEEVQTVLDSYFTKVEAIRTSGRYTVDGEREELKQAAQTVRDRLNTLRTATVDTLDSQLAQKRSAALRPKTASNDPVREMRMRELRDELRKIDPLQMKVRLSQALDAGASSDLLDALEGAPAGFPIAPQELVQQAREAIAERDHPELGELAQLKSAYEYLLGTAEQMLRESGAGVPEGSTIPDTRPPFTVSGHTAVPIPGEVRQ